jgi:bifunctional DNA-binding transcriptional regulator/antitoxin component of YhaV-PrlF toxin-antitoxin module
MQTHVAPIKENGDVTLPEEVQRRIGKAGKDNVEFIIRDDGVIELRRPGLTLDDVFGILPPLKNASPDFEEEIERAIEEHVARKWDHQLP